MRSSAILLALVVLVPLALPGAGAGSEQNPEVLDPASDVDVLSGFGVATTVDTPEIDIVAAWFESNATSVRISWKLVDASHRLQQEEGRSYAMACYSNGIDVLVAVDISPVHASAFVDIGSTTPKKINFTESGNIIRADIPRAILPGGTCRQTHASSLLTVHVGNMWTGGNGVFWWRDVAPDVGYGRDAAF
jgi:hypothetical protein